MRYNFDEIISRKKTDCVKYDACNSVFGADDLIPMWIADMDFKTPDFILNAIKKRLEHPVLGYFLRRDNFYSSIINWTDKQYKWKIEKEWISFSPGIVAGLALLINALSEKNDKIIIQPPVYNPFYSVIAEQGRKIMTNPLKIVDNNYIMDFDDLEIKLQKNAKLLILSNPHNPVGRSWTNEELLTLGNLCLKYNCTIISDEIHSDLTMPGITHIPMATISKDIANITITCMSPSKTFNIAGMTTSEIIISNPEIHNKYESILSNQIHISTGNIFGDIALEAAYSYGEEWVAQLKNYLFNNVNFVINFIKENIPEIITYNHQATYILWLNMNYLSISHEKLYNKLITTCKLGFNDGSIFGKEGNGFMRVNLAAPKSTIEKAMNQLLKIKK